MENAEFHLTAEELRTRHRVGSGTRVDVEHDTLVSGGVEVGTKSSARASRAVTADDKVEALRVALSSVLLAGGVQGDELVAEDVVAGSDGSRDGHGGRVGVLDHVVGDPGVGRGVRNRVGLDLDPFEGGLVGVGAVAVAAGQVVDDLDISVYYYP